MKTTIEVLTKWVAGGVPMLHFRVPEGLEHLRGLTIEVNGHSPLEFKADHLHDTSVNVPQLLDLQIRRIQITPILAEGAECQLKGDLVRALGVNDQGTFARVLQVPTSRIKERLALFLGALVNLDRSPGEEMEFACRTIIIHRLLEEPALVDQFMAKGQLDGFLAGGKQLLSGFPANVLEKAVWSTVRWCCSLSMVIAYVQLAQQDYEGAFDSFVYSAACLPWVNRSKVSALNVIQASFFAGLIGAYIGRRDEADRLLKQAVMGLQPVVACQSLMDNVWVVGDLINVAQVSRQAYIALGLLGLVQNTPEVTRIDIRAKVAVGIVEGPMASLIRAGRMPAFANYIKELNGELPNANR